MASKWIEQGWVSTNDLMLLGWSRDSIDRLKAEVLAQPVQLGGMTEARDLNDVNGWARNHGEPIVSSRAVKERERQRSRGTSSSGRKPVTGTGFRGSPQSSTGSLTPPPPSPAAFQAQSSVVSPQAAQAAQAKQAAQAAHRQKRSAQTVQAQVLGSWFESKRDANASGFLSAVDLRERLWTDTLMAKLLGEPDGLGHNYYNPSTPVRYWTKDHVLRVEGGGEFLKSIGPSLSRRKLLWEAGVEAIAKSNREHGLLDGRATVPWSLALAELLKDEG